MKPCISILVAWLAAISFAFGQKVEPQMLIGDWRLSNIDSFKKSEGCDWLDHHLTVTSSLYTENDDYDCKGTGKQSTQSEGTWRIKGSNTLIVVWGKKEFSKLVITEISENHWEAYNKRRPELKLVYDRE